MDQAGASVRKGATLPIGGALCRASATELEEVSSSTVGEAAGHASASNADLSGEPTQPRARWQILSGRLSADG